VTIFYSLRFETSLFVASYDSQGHGGGIRPRLHTGHSSFTWQIAPLFCNVSVNLVEVTSFNSTVIAFLAATVLSTIRCRGYRLTTVKVTLRAMNH
jgi:hypothetical protein